MSVTVISGMSHVTCSMSHVTCDSIYTEASNAEEIEDFIVESAIMLDFHHPNVLRLVGVCFDTRDKLPVIILPYMVNGDLRSFLKSKRTKSSSTSDETMPEVRQWTMSNDAMQSVCVCMFPIHM